MSYEWSGITFQNPKPVLDQLAQENELDQNTEEFALLLDKKDSLSHFRDRFIIPKSDLKGESKNDSIYLCGNSLGLQPKDTKKYIEEELEEWGTRAVEGHFNHSKKRPWLTTDEYLIDQMCHLVGAEKGEIAIMNSLSVNIHLMMVPFYRPTPQRYKIIIEAKSFPSDLYIAQSQLEFHGRNPLKDDSLIQLEPRTGEYTLRTEDILQTIETHGDSVALILLPGVQYYTGQYLDIAAITKAGQEKGCRVGWDLAHAVGNLDLQLHEWNVDFACWCSYKYLNSGPGNIAGCFVHARHANDATLPRFAGWWGHDLTTRFNMNEAKFNPIPGAFGFRLSNPPVVCTAALLASLELFENAKIEKLRAKSLLLTTYLHFLVQHTLTPEEAVIITPSDPLWRGCQLSLLFAVTPVEKIFDILLEDGIVCDVRKPNVLRVSPTPLYNTFHDVWKFVHKAKQAFARLKQE